MTSISSFRKVAAAAFVGAAFMATSAQAATLVNHAAPISVIVGTTTGTDTTPPITFGPTPFVFNFSYAGGLVKFLLEDTTPDFQTVNYVLAQGSDVLASFSLTDVADGLAKPFYSTLLGGGNYSLTISTTALSSQTDISAVPLPGAALLFGSTLLGYMGLSKRRKA